MFSPAHLTGVLVMVAGASAACECAEGELASRWKEGGRRERARLKWAENKARAHEKNNKRKEKNT
jgi:hypothetical protein